MKGAGNLRQRPIRNMVLVEWPRRLLSNALQDLRTRQIQWMFQAELDMGLLSAAAHVTHH